MRVTSLGGRRQAKVRDPRTKSGQDLRLRKHGNRKHCAIALIWRGDGRPPTSPPRRSSYPRQLISGPRRQSIRDCKKCSKTGCDSGPCTTLALLIDEKQWRFRIISAAAEGSALPCCVPLIRAMNHNAAAGSRAKLTKNFECFLHGRCPSTTSKANRALPYTSRKRNLLRPNDDRVWPDPGLPACPLLRRFILAPRGSTTVDLQGSPARVVPTNSA